MRTLLATLGLAALAVAQSPLTALTGGTGSGNVGGALYFDLQINTTITITRLDFRCGANTVAGTGTLDIWLGPTTYVNNVTNAGLWSIIASTTTTVAPSTVSIGVLTAPFALAPGNYGVALKSNAHSHGYTNGGTCSSPTIPGSCTSPASLFSTTEMTLRSGAAQNSFLTSGVFTPRVFNGAIHYTLGTAWTLPYGTGCYPYYRSFYEYWPSSLSFDLSNTSMMMAFNGSSFSMTAGANAMVTHSGGNPNLLLPNDSNLSVTLDPLGPPILWIDNTGSVQAATTVEMGSDGYVTFSGTNTPGTVPAPTPFLSGAPRVGNWHDFDPSTYPGETHYEYMASVAPSGTAAHVFSWLYCPDSVVTTSASSYQLLFYGNGNIEMRWGTTSLGIRATLVGYTPGLGSLDPGSRDISATLPFSTQPVDNHPLRLDFSAPPRLGTTPNLVTTNVPAGTLLGAALVSFTQINPGLPMTTIGIVGMDGCLLFINPVGAFSNVFFPSGGTGSVPFPIPNNIICSGVLVFAESATFSSGYNPFGVITSNGVRGLIGSL